MEQQQISDPSVRAIFQPDPDAPARALVVAGCCGNVGFGKLGQLARLLGRHSVPVVALDLAPAVQDVKQRLADAFKTRFLPDQIMAITDRITVVQGGIDDLPEGLQVGFVFEAIPERLDLKRSFYAAIRKRDPEAYIFSATSGLTSHKLFDGLPGNARCGVLHPFFPHLTNKLWEMPQKGAVTGKAEIKAIRRLFDRLGMTLIPVADVPSFAADRLFCGMMLEAVRIHADLGLSPAEVDDMCKRVLGTSPFYVHNLIRGANGLSAHCMQLMQEEVDSTLYAIPAAWQPYIDDPDLKWPYDRGQACPAEHFAAARERMLGMLFSLTAYMLEHDIVGVDALNYLAEKALAFRVGPPALIESLGAAEAIVTAEAFLSSQGITKADEVAPLGALDPAQGKAAWGEIYVGTSVHDGVGLISLKRTTLNHTFVAELDAAYAKLAADDSVKAIVLAPDGTYSREFGHGADLACFVPVLGDKAAALELINTWKATLNKLRSGKPTVAALVGRVLGGGLELATSCHARIAAEGTRLGQPETTVGVLPGLGGCHQIHRFTDPKHYARINELLLTGHTFKVDEAAAWGFVSRLVPIPELPKASFAYAAELAANGDLPAFRDGPRELVVDRNASPRNDQGVALDSELRELLASTIEDCNGKAWAEASALEGERAAQSLTMSTSRIGVKAMMRGKPPTFEKPLA
ncbi:MAG: enoyl-CoA hydratase/isomerase family protein [Myxococcales bacterium]|nr:enoyl-CoA hydratase/isomerase family protein [Myxococcales bacterium]